MMSPSAVYHPMEGPMEGPIPIDCREQLLSDGNEYIQNELRKHKKDKEYSWSQSRDRCRADKVNLAIVDWSGFSGAAHSVKETDAGTKERRRGVRRSHSNSEPRTSRTHRSVSPTRSLAPRFKNRRQSRTHSPVPRHGDNPTATPERSPKKRGSARLTSRVGRGNSNRPTSPGRIRRSTPAAASSTTLEVTRKTPQRSSTRMSRIEQKKVFEGGPLKTRTTRREPVLSQNASSIRW